jgi:hypothetical protein
MKRRMRRENEKGECKGREGTIDLVVGSKKPLLLSAEAHRSMKDIFVRHKRSADHRAAF